jgi:LemA protein
MSFVLAGAIALLVIAVMLGAYNRFAARRSRAQRSWLAVDHELQCRHVLVPVLVDTVRRVAPHERRMLDAATTLNLTAMAVRREPDAQAPIEQALDQALEQLLIATERYPELEASAAFLAVRHELLDVEHRIEAARVTYNAHARSFDILVRTFPTLVIARMFGFEPEPYFELEPAVGQVPPPSVDLSPWTAPAISRVSRPPWPGQAAG